MQITQGHVTEVRAYLPTLPEEKVDVLRAGTCTLASLSFYVDPLRERPEAPEVLNRIAFSLRVGEQSERQEACAALAELFYAIWSRGLPNGGAVFLDRLEASGCNSKAQWARLQSPGYIADCARMTGSMLGAILNAPLWQDRKCVELLAESKERFASKKIVKAGVFHTRPHIDVTCRAHTLEVFSWTDAAGYVEAED